MYRLRWIAYAMLAGLLLGYGLVGGDVRGASADTPGSTTLSGPIPDSGSANAVAAIPDGAATVTSYYATSPYYNPYYNSYYNNYYYPYYSYYPYYKDYYYPMYNYYNNYYGSGYYSNAYLYNYYNIYHPVYNQNPYYP
jgi:hypothetical protein